MESFRELVFLSALKNLDLVPLWNYSGSSVCGTSVVYDHGVASSVFSSVYSLRMAGASIMLLGFVFIFGVCCVF